MIKPPTVYYCLSCFVLNIREYSETFDDHVAFAQVELNIYVHISVTCAECAFSILFQSEYLSRVLSSESANNDQKFVNHGFSSLKGLT